MSTVTPIEFHVRDTDLSGLVNEVVERLQPMIDDKEQALAVAIDDDLPPVCADPDWSVLRAQAGGKCPICPLW
ncbi:hypothetical protein D3C72_2427740 [compost metagenome]